MELDEQRKIWKRYVTISSTLHALLFLLFGIGAVFSPKPITFLPTIQIDVVALPTQVKNADQPPVDITKPVKENASEPKPENEETAEKKSEPAKEKEMAKSEAKKETDWAFERKKEEEAKKRAQEALKKVREQIKKERLAEEQKKHDALEKRKQDLKRFEETYRKAIAGNQLNQGTSMTGQMQATLNAYVGHITDKIRSNWALPSFLQSQPLSARIIIYLDARGNVFKMEFTKISGNNLFDNYAEGAVKRSSPFLPPPAEMAQGLRNNGIEVKFPL